MAWKKNLSRSATREIVTIDATDKVVGRLATQIAQILMGKNKATYVPHIDSNVVVKVTNASKLKLTGKKLEQKELIRSTNRPGGLKRTPVSKLMQTNPGAVLEHAVKYMLPKNTTQKERLKRLSIEA